MRSLPGRAKASSLARRNTLLIGGAMRISFRVPDVPRLLNAIVVPVIVACGLNSRAEAAPQFSLYGMNDVNTPGVPDQLIRIDFATGVATLLHTFSSGL